MLDKKTKPAPRAKKTSTAAATTRRSPRPKARDSKTPTPAARTQTPCLDCGLCCSYIAIEIDPPTTVKRATQILWYLYHERVSVYWDNEEDWLVQFETRCRHLQPDNRCAVYAVRPHICREFDETSCEVNAEDEGTCFYNAQQFLDFLKARRKAIYRKLEAGYLPPAESLVGPAADRSRFVPYEPRFRRLRTLGRNES